MGLWMRALAAALALAATPAVAQVAGGGAGAAPMAGCGGDLARLNQISGWQVRWPREIAQVEIGRASCRERV